jgi:hypothetical protein
MTRRTNNNLTAQTYPHKQGVCNGILTLTDTVKTREYLIGCIVFMEKIFLINLFYHGETGC